MGIMSEKYERNTNGQLILSIEKSSVTKRFWIMQGSHFKSWDL